MDGGSAYEDLGELYDVWCAEVAEDLPFYTQLADALAAELGRPTLDIVELGAGSGRITSHLAAAGHRVTAIDLATSQLEVLRDRTSHTESPPIVVAGDMRDVATLVPLGSADLVLVPFRGLLHVTTDRDALFADVIRVLRPGGVFAFDVFHPTDAQVAATGDRWLHRRLEPTATGRWRFDERATYARLSDGWDLRVDVRCRWEATKRLRRPRVDVRADPSVDAPTERHALLHLHTVEHAEWGASLTAAGFELDGSYGWFDGRPLSVGDDDAIWVARSAH
ncbi:MAG: Methyltransferase type 12 [Thermoleophilia bacterium]|nr:Methyltransferase type 12 [Thermoleophilia bacterium]